MVGPNPQPPAEPFITAGELAGMVEDLAEITLDNAQALARLAPLAMASGLGHSAGQLLAIATVQRCQCKQLAELALVLRLTDAQAVQDATDSTPSAG